MNKIQKFVCKLFKIPPLYSDTCHKEIITSNRQCVVLSSHIMFSEEYKVPIEMLQDQIIRELSNELKPHVSFIIGTSGNQKILTGQIYVGVKR